MAYTAIANLKLRLGSNTTPPGLYQQLTDRVAATTASDAVGQELIDSASAIIDREIGGRYSVPIDVAADATLAAVLDDAALAIAVRLAWERSPFRSRMKDKFESAMAETKWVTEWLAAVAAGTKPLPGAVAVPAATAAGDSATAIGHARVFTEDALEGL